MDFRNKSVCFSAEGSYQWTQIQKSKPSKDPISPLSLAYLSGMNRSLGPTVRGLAWLTRILRPAIVSPSAPEAASWVQKPLYYPIYLKRTLVVQNTFTNQSVIFSVVLVHPCGDERLWRHRKGHSWPARSPSEDRTCCGKVYSISRHLYLLFQFCHDLVW